MTLTLWLIAWSEIGLLGMFVLATNDVARNYTPTLIWYILMVVSGPFIWGLCIYILWEMYNGRNDEDSDHTSSG
jgi:hypothetical protein